MRLRKNEEEKGRKWKKWKQGKKERAFTKQKCHASQFLHFKSHAQTGCSHRATETKESPVHHILFPNAVTASKFEADSATSRSVLNGKGQIWNNQSLLSECVKPRGTRQHKGLRPLLATPSMVHAVCPCPSFPLLAATHKTYREKSICHWQHQNSCPHRDAFGYFNFGDSSLSCHVTGVMWQAQASVQGLGDQDWTTSIVCFQHPVTSLNPSCTHCKAEALQWDEVKLWRGCTADVARTMLERG